MSGLRPVQLDTIERAIAQVDQGNLDEAQKIISAGTQTTQVSK